MGEEQDEVRELGRLLVGLEPEDVKNRIIVRVLQLKVAPVAFRIPLAVALYEFCSLPCQDAARGKPGGVYNPFTNLASISRIIDCF